MPMSDFSRHPRRAQTVILVLDSNSPPDVLELGYEIHEVAQPSHTHVSNGMSSNILSVVESFVEITNSGYRGRTRLSP
jgi:hypothetical protein